MAIVFDYPGNRNGNLFHKYSKICICKNKGPDQLLSTLIIPFLFFLYKYKNYAKFFCACTARFVSDLVGNPNCWFSHKKARIVE